MKLPAGSHIRALFAAAAVTALSAGTADAYHARDVSNGEYHLVLENFLGEDVRFRLPSPDAGAEIFKQTVTEILSEHLDTVDVNAFTDRQAHQFANMIEILTDDTGTGEDELLQAIGMDRETLEDFRYRRYRFQTLADYNYVLEAGIKTEWNFIEVGLEQNDRTIAEINNEVQEAARLHPNEPAFQVRPLDSSDLRRIRERVARQYVDTGMYWIEKFEYGDLETKEKWELGDMVRTLYRHIWKDPSEASPDRIYDLVAGNDYNRELLGLVEEALEERGCVDQCFNDFYEDIVNIHNFYNRHDPVQPVSPAAAPLP